MPDTDLIIALKAEQGNVISTLNKVKKSVSDLEKRVNEMAREGAAATKKMEGSFRRMGDKVGGIGSRMASAFKNNMGLIIGGAGIAGFVAGTKAAIGAAAGFETKLKEVSTLLGGNATGQIQKYEKAIRELAKSSSANVEELTSGLYQVISAGTAGTESMEGSMELLKVSQQAAVAGVSDTFAAVDVLTTTLNSYGASTARAQEFSDKLFKAVALGKTTFNQLANQLGMVSSIAAEAGISFGDLTAAVAAMTKKGLSTDVAVTALRGTVVSFLKPSKELKKLYKDLGFESASAGLKQEGLVKTMERLSKAAGGNSQKLNALIPDTRAFAGATILAGKGLDEFRKASDAMAESAGATSEAYAKMSDSFDVKWKKFKNQINDLFISIGTILIPIVTAAMKALTFVIDAFIEGIGAAREAALSLIELIGPKLSPYFRGERGGAFGMPGAVKATRPGPALSPEEASDAKAVLDKALGKATSGAGKKDELTKEEKARIKKWKQAREEALRELERLELSMMDRRQKLDYNFQKNLDDIRTNRYLTQRERDDATQTLWKKYESDLAKMEEARLEKEKETQKKIDEERKARLEEINAVLRSQFEAQREYVHQLVDLRISLMGDLEQREAKIRVNLERDLARVREQAAKIGVDSAEAEYLLRRRAAKEFADAAKVVAEEPAWIEVVGKEIGTGFLREIGERGVDFFSRISSALVGPLEGLGSVLMSPLDQMSALVATAFTGEGLGKMQEMLDGFLQFWENLTENLGPVLEWLASTGVPTLIDAFVKSFPTIVRAITDNLPELSGALIDGAMQVIVAVIDQLPRIIDAIIDSIPYIINAFVKNLPALALAVGKAIARAFKDIMLGRWGGETSWLKGEEGLLPDEIPVLGKLHQGGMVTQGLSTFSDAAAQFMGAVRAHSGLFVKPLQPDEVPIIAQAGEAVMNRDWVRRVGGEDVVNRMNRAGGVPAQETTVNNILNVQHLMSNDTRRVIDEMQAETFRVGDGRVPAIVGKKSVAGFEPRRK